MRLLSLSPGVPVIDSSGVAKRLEVSVQSALTALHTLEGASILTPLRASRWGQAWRADDVIDLLTDFEQRVSQRRGGRADDGVPLTERLARLTRRRERLGRVNEVP